jgi:hypothetical protein
MDLDKESINGNTIYIFLNSCQTLIFGFVTSLRDESHFAGGGEKRRGRLLAGPDITALASGGHRS